MAQLVGKKLEAGLRARQEQQARDPAEQQGPLAQEAARLEELLQDREERLTLRAASAEALTTSWHAPKPWGARHVSAEPARERAWQATAPEGASGPLRAASLP